MSTGCQKDRKTDRLTERQTDRKKDRKTERLFSLDRKRQKDINRSCDI